MRIFLIMFLLASNVFAQDAELAPMPKPIDVKTPEIAVPRELTKWQMRASAGLDFQVSDSKLVPLGNYNEPESDVLVGGSVSFLIRHRLNSRFGYSVGGEVVSRKIEQDYDSFSLLNDGGSTRYDILSFELPFYAELYLGSQGRHTLYAGPKLATPLYEHCQSAIEDSALGRLCIADAARSVFIPFQLGYHLWFLENFGFTFFMEGSLTPILDKEELEAESTRLGALAVFYF